MDATDSSLVVAEASLWLFLFSLADSLAYLSCELIDYLVMEAVCWCSVAFS